VRSLKICSNTSHAINISEEETTTGLRIGGLPTTDKHFTAKSEQYSTGKLQGQ
jgi:hypothetical protein